MPRLPKGNGNAKHPKLRRLVAGKAPWQTARFACRPARCACRSSSQKSRCAAIFGSPVYRLRGFGGGLPSPHAFFACRWGCSKGLNRRGSPRLFARASGHRPRRFAEAPEGKRQREARSPADSSPARRHGRRRASLAVPPAAPATPLPKNLASLRFSGALFYLLRGFGGSLPSPISKKPPCMGGFLNIK